MDLMMMVTGLPVEPGGVSKNTLATVWTTVVRFLAGTWFFFPPSQLPPSGCGGDQTSCPKGNRVLFPEGKNSRHVKLTTHLPLMERVRITCAVVFHLLYPMEQR